MRNPGEATPESESVCAGLAATAIRSINLGRLKKPVVVAAEGLKMPSCGESAGRELNVVRRTNLLIVPAAATSAYYYCENPQRGAHLFRVAKRRGVQRAPLNVAPFWHKGYP